MSLKSVVAQLRVNLELSTAAFSKGLDQAKGKLGVFGNAMKGSLQAAAKVGAIALAGLAAAATAAFAAISLGVRNLTNDAKNIQQWSTALGMGVEGYQVLSKAAGKFGIEQDKLNDIFKDSNEKLGEYLSTGGGGFKDFMDMVGKKQGVKAEDLIKLPPEERFQTMLALSEKQGLSLEQTSFWMESLASDATLLIPMFANGGKELENIKKQLIASGQILSNEVIGSLGSFSRNLSEIGGTMQGWGNILISGFAPQLDEASHRLNQLLGGSEGVRDMFRQVGASIGAAMTWAMNTLSQAQHYFASMSVEGTRFGSILESLKTIWVSLQPFLESYGRAFLSMMGMMWEATKVVGSVILTVFDEALKVIALIAEPVGKVATAFYDTLAPAFEWVGEKLNGLPDTASHAFNLMVAYAKGGAEALKNGFLSIPAVIGDAVFSTADRVVKGIAKMVDTALNSFKSLIDKIPESVRSTLGLTMDTSNLAGSAGIENPYKGAGEAAAKDFAETFNKYAREVIDAKAIADEAKKALQVDSIQTTTLPANSNGSTPTNAAPTLQNLPNVPNPNNIFNDAKGGGGGGKGKEKLSDYERTMKKLNDELARYKENVDTSALAEKIWSAQRAAGVLSSSAQGKRIADIVSETERLKDQKSAVEGLADSFKGMFASVITGAESGKSALSGFFRVIAQNLANQAIANLWGGLLGASGGSSGWLGKAASALGFGKIGANANGTTNWAGGLSMVGERGAELVNLPRGSRVHNAQDTKSLLRNAGGQSHVHISIDEGLRAEWRKQAQDDAVTITQQGLKSYDNQLNGRLRQYEADPYRK